MFDRRRADGNGVRGPQQRVALGHMVDTVIGGESPGDVRVGVPDAGNVRVGRLLEGLDPEVGVIVLHAEHGDPVLFRHGLHPQRFGLVTTASSARERSAR